MGDPYYSQQQVYDSAGRGPQYSSYGSQPYEQQYRRSQMQRSSQPTINIQQADREVAREYYTSPTAQHNQLAPYRPETRRRSSSHGQRAYDSPRNGDNHQLTPAMDSPRRRRSSSSDSHHHGVDKIRNRAASFTSGVKKKLDDPDHARERNIGANVMGAAGGGYLGHKFGGGGMGTVIGALVGGFAAHKIEQKHEKHRRSRRGRRSSSSDESGSDSGHEGGRRSHRSRRGSAPPPMLDPASERYQTYSRSSRSVRSRSQRDGYASDSEGSLDQRRHRSHRH